MSGGEESCHRSKVGQGCDVIVMSSASGGVVTL